MTDASLITEPVPTATLAYMPRLAKKTAVDTLTNRLTDQGMPSGEAAVLARAVVDPTDARRRLDRLTPVRVPGGTFYALETLVWAPAITPYALNNREAVARHYPAGVEPGTAEAARYRPLRPATEAEDELARLELGAEEPQHLLWSLERSAKFLIETNDLSTSIAAQGVMQHVTAVMLKAEFADGSQPRVMLGTIDGSSRTQSTHHVLGLEPKDVVVRFPGDDRAYRSFISGVEAALDRPLSEVSEEDVHRLRALQVPARIFIRYEPDAFAPAGFAKAVDSYVHLIHVEPPKPWDVAASLDAKAMSVLAELETQLVITRKKRLYLEGMMTPQEARSGGYFGEPDERALELLSLISSEKAKIKAAVRTGVIVLSKAGQVRKNEKVSIAVELALRASRSTLTRSDAKGARETLQNAYLHSSLWASEIRPSKMSLEDLRDAALAEIEADGHTWQACYRIAAQGAYWLAVRRILREARFFQGPEQRDGRSAARVLDELMLTPWGIHVLYRAIVDGRDGRPLARVDESGRRVPGISGENMEMSHEWLRRTVVPPNASTGDDSESDEQADDPGPALPTRMLLLRRQAFEQGLARLEQLHEEIRAIRDTDNLVLVDREGLAIEVTDALVSRLDVLRRQFDRYGMKWESQNVDATESDDDEPDAGDAALASADEVV